MQLLIVLLTILLGLILLRLLFRKYIDLPTYEGLLLADSSGIENIMSESRFWNIIDVAKKKSQSNYQLLCEELTRSLEKLTVEEIVQFDRTFSVLKAKTYSFRLWEAAYALNGGCSDDMFEYFRSWLIGQGKNKFYWSVKYPRFLFLIGVKEMIENYEGLEYCAYQAFLNKTGMEMPRIDDIQYVIAGKKFNENTAFFRYPELALLAW